MEKQVTRYRLEGEPQEAEMVESPDGSFVEYEDYEELILEIKALKGKNNRYIVTINPHRNSSNVTVH